ncbi:MAG: hypothetical protein H6742_12165 [Alphaproteobacteria bacterium]|nr:hypothetical protein [Alphaproteobacteria bacterium]
MTPLLILMLGCTAPDSGDSGAVRDTGDDQEWTCDASGGRMHWVVDSLAWSRADGDVSDGFDLDDDVSTTGGSGGCGIADFTGPDGSEGVDNAFARLLPVLDTTEFVGAEAIINSTIVSGEVLLIGELAGADDLTDDDCVDMALRRGIGTPMLDTQGNILASQTFDLDPTFGDVEIPDMAIVDRSITGRPFDVALPIQFLDADLTFDLIDGALRFDIQEDGSVKGAFAGGLEIQVLIDLAANTGINDEVEDLLRTLLASAADLAPDEDGQCQQISITFLFTAVPAYVYEDVWEDE